jgi:hypothetical protein
MHNQFLGSYKDTLKHIPFRNIQELEDKLVRLREVQEWSSSQLKTFFTTEGVEFTEVNDGTLIVEKGLPHHLLEDFKLLMDYHREKVAEVYKSLGIISTEIPGDYDKKLYSGLIEIITSRSN